MKQVLDNQRAVAIATLKNPDGSDAWGVAYIIVNGAGNVRVGNDPNVLSQDKNDGIPLNAASPVNSSFIYFKGILFGIADVQTNVSVQAWGGGQPFNHQ